MRSPPSAWSIRRPSGCARQPSTCRASLTVIGLARGSHVLLLDADDELLPNALATLRKLVAAHPRAGMFLGAQLTVYADGRERLRLPNPVPVASPVQLARRHLLQKRLSVSHGSSLFRRALLLQRPYPENLRAGEDIPVFAYLLVSAPVVITREPLARIHKHADSLRHDRDQEEERAATMVREVFAALPASCQSLRKCYGGATLSGMLFSGVRSSCDILARNCDL